jgi:phosphoglycerate dehydrogenase-like enzyme
MENVIMTPHVAAADPRVPQRRVDVVKENVRRFLQGEPLNNVIDKTMWF